MKRKPLVVAIAEEGQATIDWLYGRAVAHHERALKAKSGIYGQPIASYHRNDGRCDEVITIIAHLTGLSEPAVRQEVQRQVNVLLTTRSSS